MNSIDGVLDDLSPVWVYYCGRGDLADDTVRIGFDCSWDATSDFVGLMGGVANLTITDNAVQEGAYFPGF